MSLNPIMTFINNNVDYSNIPDSLPAMHTCEAFDFENIIKSSYLKTNKCSVFNEKLLYFFYGKPSYPVNEKSNRTDNLYCPVCFIIDLDYIDIFRVFPFDSGAFKNGYYDQFFHKNMKIEEFEIDNTGKAIKEYVSVIFENNHNYIIGEPKEHVVECTYIETFQNMLLRKGGFQIDERANTVEIITKNKVDIRKALKGIVLPEKLMRKPLIKEFIEKNNIDFETYQVRPLTAPSRYNEIVFQLSMKYVKR